MNTTMEAIWIMGAIGAVVGFCGGALFAYWHSDRRQKRQRKERQEIADMVTQEWAKNIEGRVAP